MPPLVIQWQSCTHNLFSPPHQPDSMVEDFYKRQNAYVTSIFETFCLVFTVLSVKKLSLTRISKTCGQKPICNTTPQAKLQCSTALLESLNFLASTSKWLDETDMGSGSCLLFTVYIVLPWALWSYVVTRYLCQLELPSFYFIAFI